MSKEITAYFRGRIGVAESVYQHDYGRVLVIDGIELPSVFEVHFEIPGEDEAIIVAGQDNRAAIPNACLDSVGIVTAYIYQHAGQNDGETEYIVRFNVMHRAKPIDDGSEDEHSMMSDAIALMQHVSIEGEVANWLEDHPEATTTVQDGSITTVKLQDGSVRSPKLGGVPFYNVTDYGIMPTHSGETDVDVYSALYDLLAEKVYYTGGIVYFPAGKYTLSYTIFIPENTTFLGDGEATEIYYAETDKAFGVGLSNAGSNVTIKNMKVSQLTNNIPFTTGAQPGCIGFSDIAKEQAIAGKYSHTFARANVCNLTAENLVFDGFYPIQAENSETGEIRNVTYRNLYCPEGCVSVTASSACIYNVLIENVTCDLLRLSLNGQNAKIFAATATNVVFQSLYFYNPYETSGDAVFTNLRQTTSERMNTFFNATDSIYLNGNAVFNSCVFNAIADEVNGIHEYSGIRKFYSCVFNMQERIVLRGNALSDTDNYDVLEDCILNVVNLTATNGLVLGYGRHNRVNAPNLKFCIWGDAHRSLNIVAGTNVSPSTHPARIIVEGSTIRLSCFMVISNTNELANLPQKFATLPIADNVYPVTIWNVSNNAARINTFAKAENVVVDETTSTVIKVAEEGLTESTAYNRALIEAVIELTRIPTPTEVFNLLG